MESIAIAKSLAAKNGYSIVPGQELFAIGLSNLLGSFTSAYPITGSFSRSAVNNTVGAQTNLSGLITSLLMLLTLFVLTPAFYFLPKFCLAAVVISSVTALVDYNECIYLWKVKRSDCFLWVVAFMGTLFLGVQLGILISVGISLLIVIYESVRPQITILWRLPGTPIYRNIKQESSGQFVPGVIILRVGSSMYFANVAFIREYLQKMLRDFSDGPFAAQPVEYVVMEMTPVTTLDSTALHMLQDMHDEFKDKGVRLAFSTVASGAEAVMERAGFIDKIGPEWLHPSVHSAVQHCVRHRQMSHGNGISNGDAEPETSYKNGNGVRVVEMDLPAPESQQEPLSHV